jgi:hypothetical protein
VGKNEVGAMNSIRKYLLYRRPHQTNQLAELLSITIQNLGHKVQLLEIRSPLTGGASGYPTSFNLRVKQVIVPVIRFI